MQVQQPGTIEVDPVVPRRDVQRLDETRNHALPAGLVFTSTLGEPYQGAAGTRSHRSLGLGQDSVPQDVAGEPELPIRLVLTPAQPDASRIFLQLPPPNAEEGS